jgi:hypothetical protein
MKRGILLNLKILFILTLLAGLPFLIMFAAGQTADTLGCEMSGAAMPDGFCGTLYAVLMIVGWSSIAILPFTVSGLLLYLLGVILFFGGSLLRAGLKRQPMSPTVKGMGVSALACIMDIDGANERRLTRHLADDAYPAWSPDGRSIVFVSNRGENFWQNGTYNLYIMTADGHSQCPLTQGQDAVWRAVWSPDGQWIAYVSWLSNEIHLVRPNGQESRRLSLPVGIKSIYSLDWAAAQ